ncbi:MAG: PD-(D/E)XK nuclease family protein [Oscillospiraceae bacterium]|nr:PD-(D/E)XK nuclease family protein [Oscillospiraceae bacterium]
MRFVIGKVRSGKTSAIISEIREAVAQGKGRQLLLVPEQYSHEAERELCEACGDRLSLYAEVMSFTGFARWSMGVHGGGADVRMDEGGKLLCMAMALKELQPMLKIYGRAADNPDLQLMMVQEADRLRAAASDIDSLRVLSDELGGELGAKLRELALVMEGYNAVLERSGASVEEPLALLARQIGQYGLQDFDRVYIDGFIDFTGLETKVIEALLRRNVQLTVCLPAVEKSGGEEYLLPSRIAMDGLRDLAESLGQAVTVLTVENPERSNALSYYADHMFDYAAGAFPDRGGELRLLQADTPRAECEAAAAEVLRAVREEGCRWRDIAVAIRGFEEYRGILESTFRRYGIPLFVTRRDALAEKPLPLWIESAYDVILSNFDPEDVTAYLRCGFSGLGEERCDELCRYLYKWQLRLGAWMNPEPWAQHPGGYGKPWTEDAVQRLNRLNEDRRTVARPLMKLRERSQSAATARAQAEALAAFLHDTHASALLEERVRRLEEQGRDELRAEYTQLWELCGGAIRQIAMVLGESAMNTEGFRDLLHAVLSRYDIGLIPVALDRLPAGDFDRMRRRKIRRLIVLGCSDDRLPQARGNGGIFNQDERDILAEHDLRIGGGDAELWREYALLYHTLTLPHDQLFMSCPLTGFRGEVLVPAMVYSQAQKIFGLTPEKVSVPLSRLSAPEPALALAASAARPGSGAEAQAAAAWYRETAPERLAQLSEAARIRRTALSPAAVEALYGRRIRISPSRLESFSSCRFQYYCSYGLKAEPDEPATFHAPEIGTFIHAILEQTAREVALLGGFRQVENERLREITRAAISDYIHTELGDFREKSARFRYLFDRICQDVYRIVEDTAEELRKSDFVPLSFELDVSRLPGTAPDTEEKLRLTGIADRVDGWIQGDQLWLRIVDYKTGRKKFNLSDIWYGRNMQMLLYLFTVCDHAEALYGHTASPAGILYLPAREELLRFDHEPDEDEAKKQRLKGKRRSGLVLDDRNLIEAWERGDEKQYIPVKVLSSDPLVSLEQMGLLRRHVEQSLREMTDEILAGSIEVSPTYVSESDNACRNCLYHSICRFEEGENGESSCPTPRLSDETVWAQLREER